MKQARRYRTESGYLCDSMEQGIMDSRIARVMPKNEHGDPLNSDLLGRMAEKANAYDALRGALEQFVLGVSDNPDDYPDAELYRIMGQYVADGREALGLEFREWKSSADEDEEKAGLKFNKVPAPGRFEVAA